MNMKEDNKISAKNAMEMWAKQIETDNFAEYTIRLLNIDNSCNKRLSQRMEVPKEDYPIRFVCNEVEANILAFPKASECTIRVPVSEDVYFRAIDAEFDSQIPYSHIAFGERFATPSKISVYVSRK